MIFSNKNEGRDTLLLLKRWLENKNKGKSFADYFTECGYRTIGIFDAGEIGRILYDELCGSDIEVKWFVDKNAEGMCRVDGIPVKLMRDVDSLPEVDVVCVLPSYDYEAVTSYLVGYDPKIRTISLKDAVYEISLI